MGAVTQANMRLSTVDGTAFVDFSAANVLTDYLNHLLVVKDSAGRVIQGYIKAAGTGETLSAELLGNTTFNDASWWTFDAAWSVGGGVASCNGTGNISKSAFIVGGRLYKRSIEINRTSGSIYTLYDGNINALESTGQGYVIYGVSSAIYMVGISYVGTVDNPSFKQVLTPSATGVTITSTYDGSTYNWAYKETGFNYNDPSGYTYQFGSESQMFLYPVLQI